VQAGFPIALLPLVACCEGGSLELAAPGHAALVPEGGAVCSRCSRRYPIRDGILSLLGASMVHPESAHEMNARDARNEMVLSGARDEWSSAFSDAIEGAPTLEAAGVEDGMIVNELGCGTGRYTLALAARAAAVIAVDFSRAGLLVLRRKLSADARVALVQADVTLRYGPNRAFDRVLSTLHSNLPGRDARMATLRNVADTLKDDGRAVVSMHHYGLRSLLRAMPAAGRYPDSGIYRYYMTKAEARREATPYFGDVRFTHIAVSIPGWHSALASRTAATIPVLRSGLGRLFLLIGGRPRREPVVGASPTLPRLLTGMTPAAPRHQEPPEVDAPVLPPAGVARAHMRS
jgi:SAM-dependent methyltransferase